MENKLLSVFEKYSKSVSTESNSYKCLIEEDWLNIANDLVILFSQYSCVDSEEVPMGDK